MNAYQNRQCRLRVKSARPCSKTLKIPPGLLNMPQAASLPIYLVEATSTSGRHDPLLAKIVSFSKLPIGWRYGNGGPIGQSVINSALGWVGFLRSAGISTIDVAPGESGEITVAANIGRYTEIINEPDGAYTIVHEEEPGREDIYEPGLSERDAKELVRTFLRETWITSAGSTTKTIFRTWEDFRVGRSATSGTAYLLSPANASQAPNVHYVITRGHTISAPIRFPIRLSTGSSTHQSYQPHIA
jgi:hypothetical protein